MSDAPPSGNWPPADHLTGKDQPPPWQKAAVIAAVTVGVGLLGITIVKKQTGKTNEDLQEDVKAAGDKAKETGKDVWGFSKEKAAEGGRDLKRGARAATRKANSLFEDEVKPNYGILGWRHVFNNPKRGK